MNTIRQPAVAGLFYPDNAENLNRDIRQFLRYAKKPSRSLITAAPKALIVPHAGYLYSGAVAAAGYATLLASATHIERVVLLGPAHRTYFHGLATTTMDSFHTPLGDIPIDKEIIAPLLNTGVIAAQESAHQLEHSLEVQLPFLQTVLDDISLIPIVVGDATASQVHNVLYQLWGERETLIIISSDLSHYHNSRYAKNMDASTCNAIEHLETGIINGEMACGYVGINGLLLTAKQRNMAVYTLDMCNSGDITGEKNTVVGYGCWAFLENDHVGAL